MYIEITLLFLMSGFNNCDSRIISYIQVSKYDVYHTRVAYE